MPKFFIDRTELMDILSDVLSLVNVKSVVTLRTESTGKWHRRYRAQSFLKFGTVLEGSCWLQVEGHAQPIRLGTGDLYLLSRDTPFSLGNDLLLEPEDALKSLGENYGPYNFFRRGDGSGERTILIGAYFVFDDTNRTLLEQLPPLVHIPPTAKNAGLMQNIVNLLRIETGTMQPGTSIMMQSLAHIALVQVLRICLASDALPTGWFGALADPKIGAALARIHADNARPWKLDELASAVGMSRTAFAARFKALVGRPALDYILHWRMQIAARELRHGTKRIGTIASQLGYGSDSAFSLAFKRVHGTSPICFRKSALAET